MLLDLVHCPCVPLVLVHVQMALAAKELQCFSRAPPAHNNHPRLPYAQAISPIVCLVVCPVVEGESHRYPIDSPFKDPLGTHSIRYRQCCSYSILLVL